MTAFDQAWEIAKTPYHGTNQRNAELIMQEGLRPMFYGRQGQTLYPSSFAAHRPEDAMEYASERMGGGRWSWTDDDDRGGPVVIRTPDDHPSIIDDDGDIIEYGENIPPELLEIIYQGRKRNIGEEGVDYEASIRADMDEWLRNWEVDE